MMPPGVDGEPPATWACDHCGQPCGDRAGGYGTITGPGGTIRLCHPDDPARPDCYVRVTVHGETLGLLKDADPEPPGVMCIGNPDGEAAFREIAALGEELAAAVRQGIAEAEAGQTTDRGSFAQYAEDAGESR